MPPGRVGQTDFAADGAGQPALHQAAAGPPARRRRDRCCLPASLQPRRTTASRPAPSMDYSTVTDPPGRRT